MSTWPYRDKRRLLPSRIELVADDTGSVPSGMLSVTTSRQHVITHNVLPSLENVTAT